MKVLIFGLGLNGGGFEAASFFLKRKDEVRITDLKDRSSFGKVISKLESLGGTFILGNHREEDFLWADIVVKSTVIPPSNKYLDISKKVITDFSYLFDNYSFDKTKIIAITGTKGKTTTASFVTHALKNIGFNAKMCGNMGISAFKIAQYLEDYSKSIDYLVCEFSSWQLRDMKLYKDLAMPFLEVAALTNIMEDHQNSYENMDHYLSDKMFLFKSTINFALAPKAMMTTIKKYSNIKKRKVLDIDKGKYSQLGNRLELIPAINILKTQKINEKDIFNSLSSYKGVAHRIEWLGSSKEIVFVNDSAATIPEAVQFSFDHFSYFEIHLICGGTDKNLRPDGMLEALKKAQSITLLDGSFTQNKLIPFLDKHGIEHSRAYKSIRKAARNAYNNAKKRKDTININQVVLLSPGAASFDFFLNEFDRGNKFKAAYRAICGKKNTEQNVQD
ncbi:MAG: Mur ligase family protein [Sphaerochaeta sp.]